MSNSNYLSLKEPSEKQKQEKSKITKITNNLENNSEFMLPMINNRNLKSLLPSPMASVTNNTDSLKISNKIMGTLKSTLDSLDLIPDYYEKAYDNNNVDIFKKRKNYLEEKKDFHHKLISTSLEEINKFNFSIMKNRGWGQTGVDSLKLDEPKTHFRPDKKELEKELGKKIVNTKLPRSRINASLNKIR